MTSKIITIDFFAKTQPKWGTPIITWKEIERVLPKDMYNKFNSSLFGKKVHTDGVYPEVLEEFLNNYYENRKQSI
jgi:hypothetical protein